MLRQEDEEFNDSLGYLAMTIVTIAISKFYAEKEEENSLEQKPRKQKANSQKGLFGPNFWVGHCRKYFTEHLEVWTDRDSY